MDRSTHTSEDTIVKSPLTSTTTGRATRPELSASKSLSFKSIKSIDRQAAHEYSIIGFMPALNIICTVVLTGVLIYIYVRADGMPITSTLAGLHIPTLISFMMTLIKMFVAGGIGYALSEHKWIRLQDGAKLGLLDVYDACTRGLGGMVKVITAIRLDSVLAPAIIFQIGLVVMGPASQQILTAQTGSECHPGEATMRYTNVSQESLVSSGLTQYDFRTLTGVQASYLVSLGYSLAGNDWYIPTNFNCPVQASNCTYNDIEIIHTKPTCHLGDYNTTMFVDPDAQNTTITPAKKYGYSSDYLAYKDPTVPQFRYDASMLHRTYADFFNRTNVQPNMTYDPSNLQYVGNQTFVALTNQGKINLLTTESDKISVHICTLSSYLNLTSITVSGRDWWTNVTNTTPINIDYNKLINNSYWASGSSTPSDLIMLNAYAIQMTLVAQLVNIRKWELLEIVRSWKHDADENNRNNIEAFSGDLFKKADQLLMLGRPEALGPISGTACYDIPMSYHLNPAAYYTLCLVLLIPLAWWVCVWMLALHRADGVSRGNSQIALLVTGLTKAARRKFKGYSHADSTTVFNHATKVDIVFGETYSRSHRRGHVAFGLPDELAPIKQRRRSLPRV